MTETRIYRRLRRYLKRGKPIPLTLAFAAMAEGLDVSTIERNF